MAEVELSIIVPVFNRNESLKRAVASIVAQSNRISVIIVDDGSAPEFAAVADELAATIDAPVQVVHSTPNRGPAAARNVGLDLTSSRFVMFLDSDDELADTAFASIDEYLLQRDDVGMVCGAVRIISPGRAARTAHPAASRAVPWASLSGVSGSFAVRTDIARAVGGYDEVLYFGENTDFILRSAEQCRGRSLVVAATNDVLLIFHEAPDERRYDAKRLDAAIHLLRRGRFDLQLPSERARLHAMAAVNAARVGRYCLSVRHAVLAAHTEPRNLRHLGRVALSLTGPLARRRWLRRGSPQT
jgi:glycosyltransferase involved in cell wall biosynthesis